jgi:hypothetical protein
VRQPRRGIVAVQELEYVRHELRKKHEDRDEARMPAAALPVVPVASSRHIGFASVVECRRALWRMRRSASWQVQRALELAHNEKLMLHTQARPAPPALPGT